MINYSLLVFVLLAVFSRICVVCDPSWSHRAKRWCAGPFNKATRWRSQCHWLEGLHLTSAEMLAFERIWLLGHTTKANGSWPEFFCRSNQWPFQEPKLEVPTIYKAYVREYPHKIWPYMVQYLHFRILEFPLIKAAEH